VVLPLSGHGRQIIFAISIAVILALALGLGVYYFQPQLRGSSGSSISTSSSATVSSSMSAVLSYSGCNNAITLNGTEYCMLNVSNETLFGNPGYTVFNDAGSSISFNGVTFTLLCPSGYVGCPNTSHNSTTVTLLIGVIDLRLTFPNNTTEYIHNFVPLGPQNVTMLPNVANSSAGIYFEFVQHNYETFLLVSLSQYSQLSVANSGFGTVVAGTNSSAVISIQLYYYNSTTPLSLNLTDILTIQAWQYIPNGSITSTRSFNGISNFTLSASQNQIVLGGPTNASEGTTVAYTLTAKPGASGTYELGFLQSWGLQAYLLASGEPTSCGFYGEIVTGNGQPNYAQSESSCTTYNISYFEGQNDTITAPGIGLIIPNYLYFKIVGISNSTQ